MFLAPLKQNELIEFINDETSSYLIFVQILIKSLIE